VRTRVKICGITRAEDARVAVQAGADAIGVIFYEPSPRCARLDQAAAIRSSVPAFVSLVLVTVDLEETQQRMWIDALQPDLLQFHGTEEPGLCEKFALPYIKSIRMRDDVDILDLEARHRHARALLLETFVPGVVGGTGQSFDWSRSRVCRRLPVILAGGLEASTVARAIEEASPYALDVSSALESSPGIKDHDAIRGFMNAVGAADRMRAGQPMSSEIQ
jgi:phosphoribosylanthranilate isomerase